MDFRDRAWFEAERYGADPWIFVRELLQNARDAGARSVNLDVQVREGFVRLVCRDDGDGMTDAHAKKFLFRLYASSKEGAAGMAGRFGVGFWSILRFEPSAIVIRSWPRGEPPWEVTLDGELKHAATATPPEGGRGTEIVLTRRFTPDALGHVKKAARQHARYLMTRDDPSKPLDVVICGERITEPLTLPAPSATFKKRGVRGVVALGTSPHVELFSKGLHVRTAANVDELLAAPEEGKGRQLDPMLEGLAPQVILDADALNLVRSRSDARDDRALRRAVELSQKELARLIERQLQFSRPVPWWKRALKPALAVAAVCSFVAGGGWLLSSFVRQRPERVAQAPQRPPPQVDRTPYQDPSQTYRGPRTDALPRTAVSNDLTYWPASKPLHLSTLHLGAPGASPVLSGADVTEAYEATRCTSDCVRMSMSLPANAGWVRLPVPSGHVLDAATLSWNGYEHDVYRTRQGEPVVFVAEPAEVYVSYRTGPGTPEVQAATPALAHVPEGVPDVSGYPTERRVQILRQWVADNVEYSNDPKTERLAAALRRTGSTEEFVENTLQLGAGDCDVQNAVLAQLLEHAGVEARLTIGYLGREGRAQPMLHAWVEYRAYDGRWAVTDASADVAPAALAAGARPNSPRPSRTGSGGELEAPPVAAPLPIAPRYSESGERVPSASGTPGFVITVPSWRMPKEALGLVATAPLLALALLFFRPRVRRSTQLDAEHDISRLLQGALARPEAFHHVPALFEQPLVPRRGGRPISLGLAYELAAAERLYSSDVGAPFTERAVKAGAVVLDAMRPEGKVVAEALGAVNLDQWDQLLRTAQIPPLLEQVNAHLRGRGERWTVMQSGAVNSEPAVLSVPGTKADKWIVVNGDAHWLSRAAALAPHRPARALFQVIDQLAMWLRLPSQRRARLLAPLAKAALHEEAEADLQVPPLDRAKLLQELEAFDPTPGQRPGRGKVT